MRRTAFTLIELVVAASLGFLVIGLTVAYFVPAMRISMRVGMRVEMQQMASAALGQIERALRSTSLGGVTLHSTNPVAVASNPLERVASDGTLVWSKVYQIFYYDSGTRKLHHRHWPPEPPVRAPVYLVLSRAKRLDPADLLNVVGTPAPSTTTLAQGVLAFRITQPGTDLAPAQPLRFELELEREVGSNRTERLSLARSVFLTEQRP